MVTGSRARGGHGAVLAERRRPAARGAAPGRAARTGGPALVDVKILDFMWVMAGPAATRVLADYGATVIRVETINRTETARTLGPFLRNDGGAENSRPLNNMNAGKLGLTLDLNKPETRDVVHDLVRWADIVTESFSPKAMRSWGLGYDELRQIKPDIIMASAACSASTARCRPSPASAPWAPPCRASTT